MRNSGDVKSGTENKIDDNIVVARLLKLVQKQIKSEADIDGTDWQKAEVCLLSGSNYASLINLLKEFETANIDTKLTFGKEIRELLNYNSERLATFESHFYDYVTMPIKISSTNSIFYCYVYFIGESALKEVLKLLSEAIQSNVAPPPELAKIKLLINEPVENIVV